MTRPFVNLIAKAHRTTSLISGCVLARKLPLDLRALEQRRLYQIKRGRPLSELPGRQLETRISPFQLPHPAHRRTLTFKQINSTQDLLREAIDMPQIFTDGSKLEGKVGAAVTHWVDGRETGYAKITLASYCSVFQAELAAIYSAIKTMSTKPQLKRAAILSDSRSALETLSDRNSLNPIGHKIKMELETLRSKGGDAVLYWVRAHADIPGNERADELAKDAALKSKKANAYDAFPLSYAKRLIRQDTLSTWQRRYAEATAGATTRIFFPDVKMSHKILGGIDIDNYLSQLFTGHGGFRSYLHKRGLAETPCCTCDDTAEQTVEHVITDCPKYGRKRYECECSMESDIHTARLSSLLEDDRCRKLFLQYAVGVVKAVGRENGAKY